MGNAGYGNHTEDTGSGRPDKPGRTTPLEERQVRKGQPDDTPPAGPHADPSLTNPDATPRAGTLTPPGDHDDVDSTSG